ncbi:MAG: hypothetical protein HY735_16365 [Verrucomicrobia bacterium]|nr:hypothetical protein [Verrucomicrobiota bacterium]
MQKIALGFLSFSLLTLDVSGSSTAWRWLESILGQDQPSFVLARPGLYTLNIRAREAARTVAILADSDPAPIRAEPVETRAPDSSATPITDVPGSITIRRDGNHVIIEWTGKGTLQFADRVGGPWTDLVNALSPFTMVLTDSEKFFRVKE